MKRFILPLLQSDWSMLCWPSLDVEKTIKWLGTMMEQEHAGDVDLW